MLQRYLVLDIKHPLLAFVRATQLTPLPLQWKPHSGEVWGTRLSSFLPVGDMNQAIRVRYLYFIVFLQTTGGGQANLRLSSPGISISIYGRARKSQQPRSPIM
ncbi:hypothetical protein ABW19_dt0201452 [Dactylella cylindrospora]|nr:hypothetical protein ABW19_dt0201452 [Dactylella cylindrospora]